MSDSTYSAARIADKPREYFGGVRTDIVAQLRTNPAARILEIGCGDGGTGALAKAQGKCAQYIGVERDAGAAAKARNLLDQVIEGDVEALDLAQLGGPFDAVILSEVLEHLVDPWALVAKLRKVMRPGAPIHASSPNIAHHRIIRALLRGQFVYARSGVMDRTHLRWFTPQSYQAMFEEAGFETLSLNALTPPGWKARLAHLFTFGRLGHLTMSQIAYQGRVPQA